MGNLADRTYNVPLKATGLPLGDHHCLVECLLVGKIVVYLFNQLVVAVGFCLEFVLLI